MAEDNRFRPDWAGFHNINAHPYQVLPGDTKLGSKFSSNYKDSAESSKRKAFHEVMSQVVVYSSNYIRVSTTNSPFSTEKSNHMTKVKSSFRRRKFFIGSDYSLTFLVISCPKSCLLWGDSIFMIR